jgi:hypothetical protein
MKVSLRKAILLYLVAYIVVFSVFYLHNIVFTETVIYESTIIVGDNIGFDLNKTALTFGMITAGGTSASRDIIIAEADYLRSVEIYSNGEIAKWLVVPTNSFVLQPNTNKTVGFSVAVPSDIELGKYDGAVKIKLMRTC